jgi:Tol biopolymer transport system component
MNKIKVSRSFLGILFLVVSLSLILAASVQQSAEELYEAAIFKKDADGDMEGAIRIFREIVERFPSNVEIAAKAQLQIGICYEKLGQKNTKQAQEAFQKVVDNYPTQSDEVKIAREKLSVLLKPRQAVGKSDQRFQMFPIWSDQEMKKFPEAGVAVLNPRPSPDGKYIAFIDWSTGFGDLYVQETAARKIECLTESRPPEERKANAYDSRWSPDGRLLAYIWENDEENYVDLRVIGLKDAKPRTLRRGSYAEEWISPLDWSPDGKNILAIMWEEDITQFGLFPLNGGAHRIIKTFTGLRPGNNPSGGLFSPDGRYIAYDSQQDKEAVNHDIYLLVLESGQETAVASHPSHDYLLGWAPDGGKLVFASDRAGTVDCWTIPVQDGQSAGKPSLAIKNIGYIDPLGITSEGTLYFNRNPDGISMNIYTAAFNPDSGLAESPPEILPLPHEGRNIFPDWSPDGSTLAYVSRRKPPGRGILCLYSPDTGKVREMSFPHMISCPCWSKDCRSIFAIDWEAHNIFRIDIETANIQTIVEGEDVYSPAISPDMNFLFYASRDKKAQNTHIMKKNIKTGSKVEICNTPWIISDLELSPDGRRLAVVFSERPYGPGPSNEENKNILGVIPSSGGDINTLHEFVHPAGSGLVAIDWSPDGRYIVFSKIRAEDSKEVEPAFGPWQLWRVPADGGQAENLGLECRRFRSLSVHPDGHRIAFFSHGTEGPQPPSFWLVENFLPKK